MVLDPIPQSVLTPVAGLNLLRWKLWDLKVFDSKLSDLKVFASNIKVNPVISWNGQNSFQRFFSESSQIFTTPQISFEFSDFNYTSKSFAVKQIIMHDRKTCPFREILSQRKGRGEHRVEQCGLRTTKNRMQIIWLESIWFRVAQHIALRWGSWGCRIVTLMPHPLKCSPQGLFGGFSFRGLRKLKKGQNTVKPNLRSEDFANTLRSESFFTGANLVLRPALCATTPTTTTQRFLDFCENYFRTQMQVRDDTFNLGPRLKAWGLIKFNLSK